MVQKTASAYLVYNWKDNRIDRTKQTKQGKTTPHETLVEIEINAEVEEPEVQKISVDLDVGEGEIREVLGSELVEEPETRLAEAPEPDTVIFEIIEADDEWKDRFREYVDEVKENGSEDSSIDWMRLVIAEEHRKMNRSNVLEFLEDQLMELRKSRNSSEGGEINHE